MREWLIMMITNWLQGTRTKAEPENVEGVEVKEEEKVELPPCPICGEEWDEKEIFCYYCGYQMSDEEIPLHPPPERKSGFSDPDEILNEAESLKIRERIDAISNSMGFDTAIFIIPESLRSKISFTEESWNGYTIDGISFALYNTWKMGSETGMKGMLIVVDPMGPDRVLVTGKKGPEISGKNFRSWFSEIKPASLVEELEHIADKIEAVQ